MPEMAPLRNVPYAEGEGTGVEQLEDAFDRDGLILAGSLPYADKAFAVLKMGDRIREGL